MTCPPQIRGLAALLILLCGVAAESAVDTQVLIVDLIVNHEPMGQTFVLQDDSGNFYVDEKTLGHWEIIKPWPRPHEFRGERYYNLGNLPGTSAELATRSMELRIVLPAGLMPTRHVDMGVDGTRASVDRFGAFMDYDLNWIGQGSHGQSSAYGLFRPVIFGPRGNISANLAYRDQASSASTDRLSVLEMTYTRDDPDKMRSLRVGDVFTNPGDQGRSLRIGGIQLATNFATRPTLITYPLPDFYGETSVPSAVDIYVNGRLSRRTNVQPGAYVLDNIPVVNGAGQMQVVATDALGRQQIFTQDFYLSTDLLAEGLHDYSFTLGALREDFGLENFRYGALAGSATWRHGLRDNLTVEGHGEFTNGVVMAASSVQYGMESGGTVSAGLGVSNSRSGTGARWQLGVRRYVTAMNYNVGISGSTRKFELVDSLQSPAKLQLIAAVGRNFYEKGSLQFSVIHQDFHSEPGRTIFSTNYSMRFLNAVSLSSYVSYLDAGESDLSAGIRFHMFFGDRHSVSGNVSNSRNGMSTSATIQRNMPMSSGYGYHVGVGQSDRGFVDAGIAGQNDFGSYSLDVRHNEDSGSIWQLGTRGSLAHMAGMTRAARQIDDAFAIVKVGDIEGVRVYAENIEIGRTNEHGQVFVPRLRPYLKNQIRIEVDDLPLNARIGEMKRETAPYYKSGILVDFDVQITTNVVIRAVLPDGTPLPEGAIANIFHSGDRFPVGMDGKLFLQGIDRSSKIEIRWSGKVCEIDVPYPSGNAVIAKMGDIVCVPRKG